MWPAGRERTARWVERSLPAGTRVIGGRPLRGGWTSEMWHLETVDAEGTRGGVVLRSLVREFFRRHAPGLLGREARVLELLAPGPVPAARLLAVDPTGEHADHPSLLMTFLPGGLRLGSRDGEPAEHLDHRLRLLARQLADIHRFEPAPADRPRTWQAWTAADRVRVPAGTGRPEVWRRAVEVIRRPPPEPSAYRPCFLHRDHHPGNVLFSGPPGGERITGVVDWVETSTGPADLDVAHCSSALALLHGADTGLGFADHYLREGGRELAAVPADRLYWYLVDALAFAPDAEKVAAVWRGVGRPDLTPERAADRLEEWLVALLERFDR
ncbi:phosphotransferase family protein [Streptomyces calidiresistens]|uniref:Phosphotransferase n=1 Tax=Streptomyces calidiresistens TaxID=1485586 RepID=A0A7W3XY42_9ACTN|nr:aminoglycoside phosphotransferase family protein [Streptomyces calidiresistens]MBB0231472.1 phosphotransferase [Streptomyces calidiresistens]